MAAAQPLDAQAPFAIRRRGGFAVEEAAEYVTIKTNHTEVDGHGNLDVRGQAAIAGLRFSL